MENTVKEYLEQHIITMYQHFDMAHQIDHVYKVIDNALEIAKDYDVNLDFVYVIACYHDVGLKFGRKDHHLTGGQFLFDDQFLRNHFTEKELLLMKEAVEDHRASNENSPRTIYGKIIAEADRDINPDTIILRTVQFGYKNYPNLSEKEHIERAYQHIEEKYGPQGYLRLWLETKKNRDGLNKIHQLLQNKDTLYGIIKQYYKNVFIKS